MTIKCRYSWLLIKVKNQKFDDNNHWHQKNNKLSMNIALNQQFSYKLDIIDPQNTQAVNVEIIEDEFNKL